MESCARTVQCAVYRVHAVCTPSVSVAMRMHTSYEFTCLLTPHAGACSVGSDACDCMPLVTHPSTHINTAYACRMEKASAPVAAADAHACAV